MLNRLIIHTGTALFWIVVTLFQPVALSQAQTYLEEDEELFDLPLAEQFYAQGIEFLDNHDFIAALIHFQRAHELGLRNTKVHYNLGACYYNLGRYAEAQSAFLKASTDRNISGLVYYNLALIAYEQNQLDQSQLWLEYALLKSDNFRLHNQIKELYTQTELHRWHGAVIMSLGNDDNVTLSTDSQSLSTSNNSDTMTEILAYGSGHLGASDLRLTLSAYQLQYQNLSQYDVGVLALNAQREFRQGQWLFTPGLDLSQVLLDQKNFNRIAMLIFQAVRSANGKPTVEWRYDINYTDDLDGNYSYVTGTRQRFKVSASWHGERLQTKLNYTYEYNQRRNYQNVIFTNYSPQRHAVGGELNFKLSARLSTLFSAEYRLSQYDEPNTFLTGSPISREDQRWQYTLGISHHMAENWDLSLSYNYTDNQSNIASYQYDRGQASLEINYLW